MSAALFRFFFGLRLLIVGGTKLDLFAQILEVDPHVFCVEFGDVFFSYVDVPDVRHLSVIIFFDFHLLQK